MVNERPLALLITTYYSNYHLPTHALVFYNSLYNFKLWSLEGLTLKPCRGACTLTILPSSVLDSITISDTERATNCPLSLFLKPVSIGQTSTFCPFFRPLGSLGSTLPISSANSEDPINAAASVPLTVFGLPRDFAAAETVAWKRLIHANDLGNFSAEIWSGGRAPFRPVSQ